MGEQRNLTEENVEELKAKLDNMKLYNPELEYRFFEQGPTLGRPEPDTEDTDAEDTITIVRGIREKMDALDRKIDLIFGGHVLMDGAFQKWEG